MKKFRKRAYAKAMGVQLKKHKTLIGENPTGKTVYTIAWSTRVFGSKRIRKYVENGWFGIGESNNVLRAHIKWAKASPIKSENESHLEIPWGYVGRKVIIPYEYTPY